MVAPQSPPLAFKSRSQLSLWLKKNHNITTELWVRIFKKDSGTPSVDWEDCVVTAIAWGWIDGQRRALDEDSFLQRLTPRRPKSNWSKKNCQHAERLIAEGQMQTPGMVHVTAAQSDGRWDQAYAGSANMVLPEEFKRALRESPQAERFFGTLNRREIFAIYHALHTAKRPETRSRRIASAIAALAEGRLPSGRSPNQGVKAKLSTSNDRR